MAKFKPRIGDSGRPCCAIWNNGYGTGDPLPPTNPCPKCVAYFAKQNLSFLQESPMLKNLEAFKPVDPYAAELAEIRAARATPMSRFEERFAAERTADFARQHAEFATFRAAQEPTPRLTAAELKKFEAPDPYGPALRALRALQEGRR